jgi:LytS/YehU family sensor histidine kinase
MFSAMSVSASSSTPTDDCEALRRERDALRQELRVLRAQVSPHFLFNTLNNLYGTALAERSPQTAERIEQLSGVMRYLLEEARAPFVSLRRELRFLDDYLHLQRIRLPERESIRLEVSVFWDERPGHIVPMLLQPLLEQAFRQGISLQRPCLVRIDLRIEAGTLTLTVQHSIQPTSGGLPGQTTEPGLDVATLTNRLSQAYPSRHTLTTDETDQTRPDGIFSVHLEISL